MCNDKTEKFIAKVKAKGVHEEGHYGYGGVEYVNANTKIKIYCNKCNKVFCQTASSHLAGRGCSDCGLRSRISKKTKSTEYFLMKLKEKDIHESGHYSYKQTNYTKAKEKVKIHCNKCDKDFWQTASDHLTGYGCRSCALKSRVAKKTKTTYSFLLELKKRGIHEVDHYNYKQTIYIKASEKVKIHCNKCNIDFWQTPNEHLRGAGCRGCQYSELSKTMTRDNEYFLSELSKSQIHEKGHYCYKEVAYIKNNQKVKIKCNKCDFFFWQTPNSHLLGAGCFCTRESKMEKLIRLYLNKNNITYEQEKRFPCCKNKKPLPFDFYIPSLKLLIEAQGIQHYQTIDNNFFGGEKALKKRQKRDKIKRQWAKENGYRLLEIPYWEKDNIEEILDRELGLISTIIKPTQLSLF